MSALIAALICPGSSGQTFTTTVRSGAWTASGARRASDSAPLLVEIGVFEAVRWWCPDPARPTEVLHCVARASFFFRISQIVLLDATLCHALSVNVERRSERGENALHCFSFANNIQTHQPRDKDCQIQLADDRLAVG